MQANSPWEPSQGVRFPVALILLTFASAANADAFIDFAEMQPPSAEDYYRYYLRKQWKGKSTPCDDVAGFLPCEMENLPPCPTEGCPNRKHVSDSGVYGIFHPGPYYITNARRVLLSPKSFVNSSANPLLESEPAPSIPAVEKPGGDAPTAPPAPKLEAISQKD